MNIPQLIEMYVFNTKNFLLKKLNILLSEFNEELIINEKRKLRLRFFATMLAYGVGAFIIFYLTKSVISKMILIGTFTFLITQISNLRSSISLMFSNIAKLYSDNLFVTDTFLLLESKPVLVNGSEKLAKHTPEIIFKNVSFSYPNDEKKILKNINLTINAGEKVAIVGINGAGKTTFTKLLMRFYDPTEGGIFIDNKPLKDIDINSYYSKIGILSQEYGKYNLPVKESIAMGNIHIPVSNEKIIQSAEDSGSHSFISEWKDKYDTQLGKQFEGGKEPSIGQWQKLALARLFYRNSQIWVLDEPTSSIDAVAEMEVFNKLENLPKDKTVILISHRFNTVKNADKIIVIDDGQIAEIGNHNELMHKNGIYHSLFTAQKNSYT